MSDEKIAEIRARHAQSEKNYIELEATWKAQVHEDRAWLLAEVERLARERDEARAALRPFSELYLWPDDAGRLIAERVRAREDWDEGANEKESNPYCILRGEIRAARKALEAKP